MRGPTRRTRQEVRLRIGKFAFQVFLAVGCVAGLTGPATAQVTFTSKAAEVSLSGRLQLQATTSTCSDYSTDNASPSSTCGEDVPGVDMFIRRARFTLHAKFNDWIEGRIQPDFDQVDGVVLKDAFGRLNLNPEAENSHARITVGHFKRPFDGFQMTSSTQILTIERDVDIPGVSGSTALSLDELTTRNRLSDRDIGVMVDGSTADGRFEYWVGAFNGNGPSANEDLDTDKQFIGRAAVNLDVGSLPLQIAVAGALTDVPFTRPDESLGARRFGNVEVWGELGDFTDGAHVQAGLVFGENALQAESGGTPDLVADEPFANMYTWQAIGSYKIPLGGSYFFEAIEPVFRVTMADPNTDLEDDAVWGFTPGVQIFFAGRNKLALNWDIVSFADDSLDGENSFKAQYQFHF